MKALIKAISYYLPDKKLTNKNLSNLFPEWSAEKIAQKIGINERSISGKDEFSSDLAIKAAQRLFQEHKVDPTAIDFILLCTQSPDYFLPTTACILQERLGLPVSIGALDFNLGCSGFVYGLSLAKGLIFSGSARNILLITAETYSKFIHPMDKSNRTIFGDAAAATLISSDNGWAEIRGFDFGTDGRGAENLIVKRGGIRYPADKTVKDTVDEFGNIRNEHFLFMNGTEIFGFTSTSVPVLVNNTLKKNNLSLSEIDLFIFHQANQYMLNHLRKKIKIPQEKFYYYMNDCGNTVSSTIPIAMYHAYNEGLVKNNVLLAGFGVGYSWAGCLLKII